MTERFDVFISHNGDDKPVINEIVERLKAHGIGVWIDHERLRPGRSFQAEIEKVIASAGSAIVAIGAHGLGPWEEEEARICIREYVTRELPVIPLLLPGGPDLSVLPSFLANFHAVDLREGITDHGIRRLVVGITGTALVEATRDIVVAISTHDDRVVVSQFVDSWGTAAVRSHLHSVSEVVAQAAFEHAAAAAAAIDDEALSMLVPLTVELRWRRGYAKAIELMLRLSKSKRRLEDCSCREVDGCPVSDGILSAAADETGDVIISLDGHPALMVTPADAEERQIIIASVNAHGRLGAAGARRKTLIERIGAVELHPTDQLRDDASVGFLRNRTALAALLARKGMVGFESLAGKREPELPGRAASVPPPLSPKRDQLLSVRDAASEQFDARNARLSPEEMLRSRSKYSEIFKMFEAWQRER